LVFLLARKSAKNEVTLGSDFGIETHFLEGEDEKAMVEGWEKLSDVEC